jgi:hypothetical protein
MYCSNCGRQLLEEAKFCVGCGMAVAVADGRVAAQAPPAPQPQAPTTQAPPPSYTQASQPQTFPPPQYAPASPPPPPPSATPTYPAPQQAVQAIYGAPPAPVSPPAPQSAPPTPPASAPPTGLFKPAWASKNKEKALKAVEKATDQAKLAEIAKNAPDSDVRYKAIMKLDDQNALAYSAKNDGSSFNRWEAADKLLDKALAQSVFVDIALNDNSNFMRMSMIKERLDDQSVLTNIAKRDKSPAVRKAAVEKLTGASLLADIAKNDESGSVRCAAVKKLSAQKPSVQPLLLDIFNNDRCMDVRAAALSKIKDDEFARTHIFSDQETSPRVRIAALQRCSKDKSLLESVLGFDPAHDVRKRAAELLGLTIPLKDDSYRVAQDMARMSAFNSMMDSVRDAARSGNASVAAYSPRNAQDYLSRSASAAPSVPMRFAAARQIATEAIDYIAYAVDLSMKPDLELLSHENAIKKEMETEKDFAGIQALVASYLIDIGMGRVSGTRFPTQAPRLVYLLTDKDLLRRIASINSRVYEYQKIKTAAEIMLIDLGEYMPATEKAAGIQATGQALDSKGSEREEAQAEWTPTNPRYASNMPLSSLVRIFIFTDGDGQTVFDCPVATGILADTVGASPSEFLGKVPFDVIARADTAARIKQSGQFPDSAWIAMGQIDVNATSKAQTGIYKSVVRTFDSPITKESGACVLLYEK